MNAACAFCGRDNEAGSRFCMDCGKPLDPPAARAVALRNRLRDSDPDLTGGRHARSAAPASYPAPARSLPPTRISAPAAPAATTACPKCGRPLHSTDDLFCARCGARVGERVSVETPTPAETAAFAARREARGPKLALLDDHGDVATVFTLERGEAVVGRGDADIRFSDDAYMSPLHARLELRDGALWLRDLGSRNMSWVFIDEPMRLSDGDLVLVGSQVLRFRRLGFPGPYTPEVDSTRRMGSLTPSADVATLEQLRPDGSVRDTLHLSPGRSVIIGRELGDWVFPYDQTMSGRHAEIRSEEAEFVVHDVGSRNGVAVAVRGGRALKPGQRLLLGDQLFRVEST